MDLCTSRAQVAQKILPHLHAYITTAVHKLYDKDCESQMCFVNLHLRGVHNG